MITPKQRISNALQAARALLREGWCQDHFHYALTNGRHRYCIVGAMQEVTVHRADGLRHQRCYLDCLTVLHDALDLETAKLVPYLDLQEFNDAPARTQEEVLALFDRVLTEITK